MKWQGNVGTVIVVRKNGRYLDPKHLKVLCDFCQYHMQRLFQDLLEDMQNSSKRQAVEDELTHTAFERYFQEYRIKMLKKYKKKESEQYGQWQRLQSPYLIDGPSPIPEAVEPEEPQVTYLVNTREDLARVKANFAR